MMKIDLAARLFFWLLMGEIFKRFLPFKIIAKMLGKKGVHNRIEPTSDQLRLLKQIKHVLAAITRRQPIKFNCLARSFAVVKMLKKLNINYTVFFGVNHGKLNSLDAHAWVQCGSVDVVGCESKKDFHVITTFGLP